MEKVDSQNGGGDFNVEEPYMAKNN